MDREWRESPRRRMIESENDRLHEIPSPCSCAPVWLRKRDHFPTSPIILWFSDEMSSVPEKTIPVTPEVGVVVEKKEEAPVENNSVAVKTEPEKTEENTPADYMKVQLDGSSLGASIVNMMNTIVGAGVLSIPLTVKKAGLVGSFIVLAC